MNLKEKFTQLCFPFTENQSLIDSLWLEIEKNYSEQGRYYHTLRHLENIFLELESVKTNILNFSNISFSIFYHDIIYNASSKINEEKSAEFADLSLQKLNIDQKSIEMITHQIIATKMHKISDHSDINYLLDADLSILGGNTDTYIEYTKNIRKEYSIYPDFLYKPGRKKVLHHFLALDSIFKTDYFKDRYESQARENMKFEIKSL